jgi:Gnt-I system high-affinity gluconate transporter
LISTSAFFKHPVIELISEPNLALFFSLIVAMYILGFRRGVKWDDMRHWILDASKEVTPLILTFAGAGAFKEILQLMNIGNEVMSMAKNSAVNPLFLGWLIAAMLRVITGSSTVAGITTAGIILPVLLQTGVNPNLMVLSIGAGSMVLSHVNDTGFWLFKEYFGVSVKHTLRSWTVMETILAVAGLVGVLVLQKMI